MTLEVQEKSFIRLLSVDTGFQAVVYYGDLHANECWLLVVGSCLHGKLNRGMGFI